MMTVAVETEPGLRLSKPRLLFEGPFVGRGDALGTYYDVAPDGEHFVMFRQKESAPARIHVILNWAEDLKAKVPPAIR
jgi:hypothetical protein